MRRRRVRVPRRRRPEEAERRRRPQVADVVARRRVEQAGVAATSLTGLGVTNQRETVAFWERASGRPAARAIVWQDRRTADFCRAHQADEPWLREKTGLVLDPYFSGTKLRWLLDHVPRAGERARAGELAFGTIDTWLVWKLTGGAAHVTDPTNASRTLLCDLETGTWDAELCRLLDVPQAILPAVRPSSGVVAEAAPSVLGAPVPIAGRA